MSRGQCIKGSLLLFKLEKSTNRAPYHSLAAWTVCTDVRGQFYGVEIK
jgi:hypothetical protein